MHFADFGMQRAFIYSLWGFGAECEETIGGKSSFASMFDASAAPAFEVEAICRTAIASLVDRNPKRMQVTLTAGDVVFLTYVLSINNLVWTYRCRIEAIVSYGPASPDDGETTPKDEKVAFDVIDGGNPSGLHPASL